MPTKSSTPSRTKPLAFPAEHPHHYPQPNEEGIANVQEIYRRRLGRDLSHDEAYRVLASVMAYLWAINQVTLSPHRAPPDAAPAERPDRP